MPQLWLLLMKLQILFCELLDNILVEVPDTDKIVLQGDFNAWVERNSDVIDSVLVRHRIWDMNNKGLRLLSLCSQYVLVILKFPSTLNEV